MRTQLFREFLTSPDTIQKQSVEQNLRKLDETAGFSEIYNQSYSGYILPSNCKASTITTEFKK